MSNRAAVLSVTSVTSVRQPLTLRTTSVLEDVPEQSLFTVPMESHDHQLYGLQVDLGQGVLAKICLCQSQQSWGAQ